MLNRKPYRFLSFCLLIASPALAYADVVNVLQNFLSYLTSDVGKAIAGLAIVGVGFGCFAFGKVPKSYVIAVVIGVGIVFGTQAILTMLTGGQ